MHQTDQQDPVVIAGIEETKTNSIGTDLNVLNKPCLSEKGYEMVEAVGNTGLKPIDLICDQGTSFQSTLKYLQEETHTDQIIARKNTDDTIVIDAYPSPLLDIGLSNCTPLRSILGYSHPAPASHLAQIVTPPCLRTSYTTFAKTRSPLQNSSTPTVIGSSANMASPLPLQLTNPVGYVDNSGSLSDYLISDAILQRNAEHSPFHSALSDFEPVDQPYRQCLH
ncbi:hypothetical protein evm_009222 [Chilo suppressalis]|nr:hypothetical protein evm_009222 [Chilo suppressalis]